MNVKINSTGGLSVGDATNGYKDLATKEYVDNKTFTVSWNDVSGKPTTFTPASHNHSAGDINSGTLDIARIPTGTSSTTVSLGNHTHSDYVSKSETAAQGLHSSISTTLNTGEIAIRSSSTGGGEAGLYADASDGYVWVGVGSSQSWLQKDRIGYTMDGNTQTELMFPARTSSDEVKTIATTDEANLIKVLNLYVDETTPTTAFEMDSSVGWYRGCIGSDGVLPTLDWSNFSMPADSVYQCTLALMVNSSASTLTGPSNISWVAGAGLPTSSFAGHWIFISLIREGWGNSFTQAAVWRVL